MRIVGSDGIWASGFMIDDNWMLTVAHVVDIVSQIIPPWTVEANVPASSAAGAIQPAAVQDRFFVANPKDPATVAIGSKFQRGYDWALVYVPDNAFRSPGEGCNPTFYCGHDNGSAAETFTVRGFGLDSNDPAYNGILQTDTGPASIGGANPFEFRYVLDTEGRSSGSPVTDSQGRIVGIHGFASCGVGGGDNAGSLISNPALLRAVLERTGKQLCSDGDADGLASDFEALLGTNPTLADSDTDGDSDLVEFVAKSDPLDAAIRLSPSVSEAGNDVELSWSSTTGVRYDLLYGDGLAQSIPGTTSALLPTLYAVDSIVATGNTTSLIDDGSATGGSPSATDQRLYALQVSSPLPLTVTGNPVGFVRTWLPESGYAIVGMPFVPDDFSLNAIFADQLDGAPTAGAADQVLRYNLATQAFDFAFLIDGTGTPDDGQFFGFGGPSTLTMKCGEALMVNNRGDAQGLFLSGRVNMSPAVVRVFPPGYSMFARCFSVASTDNDDTTLAASGAHAGPGPFGADRIFRLDLELQRYVGQYLSNKSYSWVPDINAPQSVIPQYYFGLEAGTGYFFRNLGPGSIVWPELRPYDPPPLLP